MQIFISLIISLVFMIGADFLWIGYIGKDFYTRNLSSAINLEFSILPGLAFYILYFVGLYVFALAPGAASGSMLKSMGLAALFGFMCYMTYDLTNMATIKSWPIAVTIVDILWGTMLAGAIGALYFKVYQYFL